MQKIILFLTLFFTYGNLFANEEYFLTLRNEKVNLRQGPSFDYPVKIFYKKKYLPVIIQDSSNNFRKVRDHENNSGWIHIKDNYLYDWSLCNCYYCFNVSSGRFFYDCPNGCHCRAISKCGLVFCSR